MKCQEKRYRAGGWEFPIVSCHRTSGAGLEESGITEQEQTVEQRRDGTGGLPWLQGETAGPMGRGRRAAPRSGYSSVLSTLALGRGQKPDCGAS